MEKEVNQELRVDLDSLLINEIGQFGRFQLRTLAFAAVAIILSSFPNHEYVFTSARIKTRCLIPECENISEVVFTPSWFTNAVPTNGGSVDSCNRFGNVSTDANITDTCPAALFDTDVVFSCQDYVYENTHSVVYDFDLACDEWRRSMFDFVRGLGMFVCLPLTGFISDRWGRRTALAINAINIAWLGIARYWATSYSLHMAAVAIEATLSSGVFSSTYILVLELVGPKYRTIAAGVLSSLFGIGEAILGITAWAVPYWRSLILTLYIPQFVAISYFWIFPESIRWYMSKGRYEKAEHCLKKVAEINRKPLSEKSLQLLWVTSENNRKAKALEKANLAKEPWLISLVFKHKLILVRCIIIPFCWVSKALTLQGLTVNSVNISGNPYISFLAVALVQIPDNFALSLIVYLTGKCSVSGVAIGFYVYTSELFPTKYRHNLLAYCAMIGNIGSIVAPLTPAIGAATFEKFPFMLFAGFAILAGFSLCFLPETLDTKLPDTMEEAENIGKTTNDKKS